MKNDFQQLVDRRLSGLQWDEQRARRVLSALEPEGGSIMKKKLTLSLSFALILIAMASIAFAAMTLMYSPSASALKQAREALIEQYGLTHTTLGMFLNGLSVNEDETIVTFEGDWMASYGGNAGDYTVILRDGDISVSWTHDDVDPALWASGNLDAPVWGQPQLERFLREKTIGGTIPNPYLDHDSDVTYEFATNTPEPAPAVTPDMSLVSITIAEVTPAPGDLTKDEALAIARAALMENFDLTETQMADDVDIFFCQLKQVGSYEPRFWSINAWCQMDGFDWNMYVEIDASTGEIISIGLQTGGNG